MKLLIIILLLIPIPIFATVLQLGSVKQVVYLHGSDEDVKMRIIDVPFASAHAAPEWRFAAVSKPFVPPSDGSWREPSDVNLASLYGIVVSGTYKEDSNDVMAVIDITKAIVPEGYPFTVEQVTKEVKKCIELMYPYNPKADSNVYVKIVETKKQD